MKKINPQALARSTSFTIILIVIMTIWSELHSAFKGVLTDMSGHHWVSKGIISLVFFAIMYFIMHKKAVGHDAKQCEMGPVWMTVAGGLIIFIFYLWHYLAA